MEKILESLLVMLVGMTGVFTSLVFLAGMIWFFRWADEKLNKWKIRRYAEKVESHQVEDEINDELIALLSAAAATALHKSVVVKKVQFLNQKTAGASWAVTGRLNVMASHAISKRKS
ncbi:MAG: OadG family protein [Bacteroidetes bacterium]|nr:OadG family protein [Bacteroidota bacterium]MCW5896556.1 OadG family protein [Bacteroidota bacterium]